MTTAEVLWMIDACQPVKMFGSMTEYEVEELYNRTYGDISDE